MAKAKSGGANYAKWRAISLGGVWVLFAIHFIHWKLNGTTLAPLEVSEVLYTIHQGIITGGFILMVVIMIATIFFGRFFCGWGCHMLSLQDGSTWILKKLKIRPNTIRSRSLLWIPFLAMIYLFIWPQISMLISEVDVANLHVIKDKDSGWTSFVTDDMWRNLPGAGIAITTFFVLGFLLIYMLGSRSFCFYGCPYGALFGLADQVAPGRIKLTGDCVQCGVCTANCESDILVHKEIKEFGMVTSDRCFKCMDCVGGCPEHALSFGFSKPPLFKKKFKLDKYKDRYSFSLLEDVIITVVFVISIFIYRALYDIVPFLLSIGISVGTAYLAVLVYRMFKKKSAKLRNLTLKISGKVTTYGYIFAFISAIYFAFTIHSGVVHYHHYMGQTIYKDLIASMANKNVDNSPSSENIVILDDALYHFEKAQRIGLINPKTLKIQISSIYLVKGEPENAAPQLESVIEENPDNLEARFRLGVITEDMGDFEKAEEHFLAALIPDDHMETNRDYELRSLAHLHLSKLMDKKGETKKSKSHLTKALQDDENNFDVNLAIGVMYLNSGKPEEAVKYLETAVKTKPNSLMVHNNLGAIYSQLKKPKKAIPHYKKLVELQKDNHQGYYNLAMSQYSAGQLKEAETNIRKALELNPSYLNAQRGLERIMSERSKRSQ